MNVGTFTPFPYSNLVKLKYYIRVHFILQSSLKMPLAPLETNTFSLFGLLGLNSPTTANSGAFKMFGSDDDAFSKLHHHSYIDGESNCYVDVFECRLPIRVHLFSWISVFTRRFMVRLV
jgi:hypothetical protein